MTLHGSQQGVVIKGLIRYGGDVVAVEATAEKGQRDILLSIKYDKQITRI